MKRCNICGEYKDASEFYGKKCRPCFSKETQARKRGEYLAEKFCVRCEQVLLGTSFEVQGKSLKQWCKNCESPAGEKWCYACKTHKSIESFTSKSKTNKCDECLRDYEWVRHLVRSYGITVEDYQRVYDRQEGKCWICQERGRLVIDHNHADPIGFRALLCSNCNTGLGMFQDQPILLNRAAQYLHTFGYNVDKITVHYRGPR